MTIPPDFQVFHFPLGRVSLVLSRLPQNLQVIAVCLAAGLTEREVADRFQVNRQVVKRAKCRIREALLK